MDAVDSIAVKEFLANRDWPCRKCKYNLRGAAGTNCPECGTPISIVGPGPIPEDEQAFLAGLCFSVVVAAIWVVAILMFRGPLPLMALVLPIAMAIATLLVWVTWAAGFRRLARSSPVLATINVIGAWSAGAFGLLLLVLVAIA